VIAVSLLVRAAVLAVTWWVLADGSFYNWPFGLGFVVAATAATWWLFPPARRRSGAAAGTAERRGPLALVRRSWAAIRLAGWFLARSLIGGIDVARRAVTRVPDTAPHYVEHRFRLPPGGARVVVAYLNNLMPGSLSVHIGDVLVIHSISEELPTLEQVVELEDRVAAAAGIELA